MAHVDLTWYFDVWYERMSIKLYIKPTKILRTTLNGMKPQMEKGAVNGLETGSHLISCFLNETANHENKKHQNKYCRD
jgi:hypothetical protein